MKYILIALALGFNIQIKAQEKIIINGPSDNGETVIHPKANIKGIEPKIDALVKQYLDLNLFSGVVLVAKKGKPIYLKGFGMANIEKQVPVTINSVFDIGSMNKAFTKVIICNLVSEGKLKLDDKLGKYLDGFPKVPSEQVTIQHLLDHRSGFQDYHSPEYMQLPADEKSIEVIVENARKQDLLFPPGEGNYYSNVGYTLLGAIIEKVMGKSYCTVVQQYILDKLKMESTYLDNKYSVPNRAIGYEANSLGILKNTDYLQLRPTPAGSFMSTAEDMSKFFYAYYYGNEIWNDETRKLDSFEYELIKESMINGSAPMIAGGFEGVNSVSLEILRDHVSVIVLANRNVPSAIDVGVRILDILRGMEPMPVELPITQTIVKIYFEKGIDFLRSNFNTLLAGHMLPMPEDAILNQIGYDFLFEDKIDDAIVIFKLNTELFPNSPNAWDSYGEALLKKGQNEEALSAFKKALEIDPNFPSAKKAIQELEK